MEIDLRSLLGEAYRSAAVAGADMFSAARALEAVRTTASGADWAFAVLREVKRQIGMAVDAAVVDALAQLERAVEAAKVAEDVAVLQRQFAEDAERGWSELCRRFAQALAEWRFDIARGTGDQNWALPAERRDELALWMKQLRHVEREEWPEARTLLETLGRHDSVPASDRARLLARNAQVLMYYDSDKDAAKAALDEARPLAAAGDSLSARAEVACVEGQWFNEYGDAHQAMDAFEVAMRLDPSFEDTYRFRGELLESQGKKLEAEKCYNEGIENAPGGTFNIEQLAKLLGDPSTYQARRLRLAELRQHAFRVEQKRRYSLYLTFGEIALQNDDLDDADHLVKLASEEDRTRPGAWSLAANIAFRREDVRRAVQMLQEAAKTGSSSSGEDLLTALEGRANQTSAMSLLALVDAVFAPEPAPLWVADTRIMLFRVARKWDEAETASNDLLQQNRDEVEHRRRLGRIRNSRGNTSYESGDYADAAVWYARAAEAKPQDAVIWSNLALALDADSRADGRVERLQRAVDALDRALAIEGNTPSADYVRRRDHLALTHRQLSRYGARALDIASSIVRPIGVEVGKGLLKAVIVPDTTTLSESCLAAVDHVRQRVKQERGVNFPSVNFRDWTNSSGDGEYLTSLAGLPVTRGTVPTDCRFVVGNTQVRPHPGWPPARDPLSGDVGYWVHEVDIQGVSDGARVSTPLQYVLLDLARVYLKNAQTELTLDDVAQLVESATVKHAETIVEDTTRLQRVAQVVRGLVAEGTPVLALDRIVSLVDEAPPNEPVTSVAERVRLLSGVRERLRGNRDGHAVIELSAQLCNTIRSAIWRRDTEPALAIAPEACQEFLSAVREMLPANGEGCTLVTDDDVRPFVDWVMALEFPEVAVLKQRETAGAVSEVAQPEGVMRVST